MSYRNPFIYGRPVRGDECICRSNQLQTVFNRLRNGESSAVVGEPHIGKTSFLFQLTDPEIQKEYLDGDDRKLIFANLDVHSIGEDYKPADFWADALLGLSKDKAQSIETLIAKAQKSNFNRQALEALFSKLASQNKTLVLLLDEFERLLKHSNFKDPGFFAQLRSLGTRTGGLAIVIFSRIGVAGLNQMGRALLDTGSPFFNNMIEVNLPPFDNAEIDLLLSKANPSFSNDEKSFIRRAAGRNPFLLQAMAGALQETNSSSSRCEKAAEVFYKAAVQYFDDLWNYLDDDTRTIAVILSLQDFRGRALGSGFSFGEIERVDMYRVELQNLAERGLAERLEKSSRGWIWDSKNLLVWRDERWGVSCAAFTWWVRDVAIASTRSIPKYDEWLKQKKYIGLLTQKQWDETQNLIKKIPTAMLQGVGGLARSLWDEVTKAK
jgi:hypothetical protein